MRLAVSLFLAALAVPSASAQAVWAEISPDALARTSRALPTQFHAFTLDRAAIDARLAEASREAVPGSLAGAARVPLPLADGAVSDFLLVESSIMEPGLQARFPELRTYVGARADDPATTVRVTATPSGVSAWIQSPGGLAVVDPLQDGDHHIAYARRDARPPAGWAEARHNETVEGISATDGLAEGAAASRLAEHGATLRLYQLAVGATGEYTRFHGGTVEAAMEAIVVAMARVNALYERDVAVRMLLVDNNDKVIFTDPDTDPYTDGSPSALFGQNQGVLDDSLGNDSYDIGHVFSTGGGGVAGFGVVCRDARKAQGVTGLPAPIGDPFYVDYVAHEMGHQFRASHTFNGSIGACSGGNRSASTAYEPGSGSTIMGYAGICGSDNIQGFSDPYFHTGSLRQIWEYVSLNAGETCADEVETENAPPMVTVPVDFSIPVQTPFALTGSATDETPASLTYAWEEVDRGPAGAPPQRAGFSGDPPLFRSFLPTTSPSRGFPRPDRYILGLPPIVGEALPVERTPLMFRLIVRDNRPGAGAVGDAFLTVTADEGAGPFRVTSPNEGGLVYAPGEAITVTWDVAGTASLDADGNEDANRVDVDLVNIFFSSDNGRDFQLLLRDTENDGAETITLPAVESPEARILVSAQAEPLGSIFYDVNDVPFALQISTAAEDEPERAGGRLAGPWPNPASREGAWVEVSVDTPQRVDVALYDALGRRVRTLFSGAMVGGEPRPVRVRTAGLAPGLYVVRLASKGVVTSRALTVLR